MKKIISLFLAICFLLQFSFAAFAGDTVKLLADDVSVGAQQTVLIPVKTKGNHAMMGFKITVKYSGGLTVDSVSRGTLTEKGNFYTNIGTKKGAFDIVWNHTTDVKEDGTLFVLVVKTDEKFEKSATIALSYSQPDTFNEAWKDVVLSCPKITVAPLKDDTQTQTQTTATVTEADEQKNSTQSTVNDSQIVQAVQTALDEMQASTLADVKDKTTFIEKVNKNLSVFTDNGVSGYKDFKSLEESYYSAYGDEAKRIAEDMYDDGEIEKIIDASLKKAGASDLKDLTDEQKKTFVEEAEKALGKQAPDFPKLSKDLPVDKAFEVIRDLANSRQKPQSRLWLWIGIPALIVFVVLIILFVLKQKKNKER